MKKLIYTLLTFMVVCSSCVQDVDDVYDKPVAQRVEEAIQEYHALLLSSEHGWLMEYYPHSSQIYGGFNYIMKFEEGDKVTVSTDAFGTPEETAESLFSLKKDIGPTLNFDSYNELFHYFSDPDNPNGAGTGKGYEGDYEFLLRSHTENEIILRGKKTKNMIRMTRLTEDATPYLASAITVEAAVESVLGILGYAGELNGQEVFVQLVSDRRMDVQVNGESQVVSFIYTADGVRFYQPVMIGGKEIDSLQWLEKEQTFVLDGVTLVVVPDPVYSKYQRFLGEYTVTYNSGNNARVHTVTLNTLNYSASEKSYILEGFPFPLRIQYNEEKDCMEILTYTTSSYYVAVWEVQGNGSLTWSAGLGLIGELREGTDNEYVFVDNGVWQDKVARALILWSANGEYKGFGDSRYQNIVFIKK